ncbi:XdhC family protein [Streptomyces sp. NPDC060198]|uniref:XdhC family protein n=1 Tax=Streptomyces sp. NPDC060198 TaxID=3347070 RepID=UPI003649C1F1
MLDLAGELRRWRDEGKDFAVATVVGVQGSAPRQPGAALALDRAGTVLGSVSGGCVEGAVHDLCERALDDGNAVLERFGFSDEDAFAVGLTCGGIIDVLVTPVLADAGAGALDDALDHAAAGRGVALVRVLDGLPEPGGRLLTVRPDGSRAGTLGGDPRLDGAAAAEAAALLAAGRTGTVTLGADGSYCGRPVTLFVESSAPPPRLIVFGANDFAAALTRIGVFLGYRVTVCDARPAFLTPARFPGADEVVVDWPHRYLAGTDVDARTVLCVVTHDPKFDLPLLALALRLPVAYVGAMGSRRVHGERVARLRAEGVTEAQLARLASPIGLDLGGRTPEETAISVAAQLVARRHGGTGLPLASTGLPLHRPSSADHAAAGKGGAAAPENTDRDTRHPLRAGNSG